MLKSFAAYIDPRRLPRAERGLIGLVLLYVLAGYGLSAVYGRADEFSVIIYGRALMTATVLLFLLFVGARAARLMIFVRPKRLTRALIDDIRQALFTADQVRSAGWIFLSYLAFIGCFTSLKNLIPVVQTYAWDETFFLMDRALHGGIDPWQLLQPMLGYPAVTFAVNVVYNLWFLVMMAMLYWQLFRKDHPALRLRFFYVFFLTWIVNGTILAMAFSSVGPCFYGRLIGGDDPYDGLISYLHHVDSIHALWALETQNRLWDLYQSNNVALGAGISAMPSVHVATAFLFLLACWHMGRAWRLATVLFFVLILAGSVHLGWHYAVDGYLGMFVTGLLWWGSRCLEKKPRAAASI